MEEIEAHQQSCFRGLRRYQLGEYFGMWVLSFYQEMVALDCIDSKAVTATAAKTYAESMSISQAEKEKSGESEVEDKMLANSYLIRC